jgi:hypothetical protein
MSNGILVSVPYIPFNNYGLLCRILLMRILFEVELIITKYKYVKLNIYIVGEARKARLSADTLRRELFVQDGLSEEFDKRSANKRIETKAVRNDIEIPIHQNSFQFNDFHRPPLDFILD